MTLFVCYIAYNIPSLIHTLCEKNKIQKNTAYSAEQIHKILHLMTYDQNTRVLLWTWENEVDMWHVYWMRNSIYSTLKNLLVAEKKKNQKVKIQAGITNWTSYNLQWEKMMHTTKFICEYSHTTIQWLAKDLWITQEKTYALMSSLLNLSLWEHVEKWQSKDLFVEFMTKSWYNQNDLNANITWMLEWLKMHKNQVYHLTPEYFFEIITKLQQIYGIWDATYYLEKLQKDHDIHITITQSVTKH